MHLTQDMQFGSLSASDASSLCGSLMRRCSRGHCRKDSRGHYGNGGHRSWDDAWQEVASTHGYGHSWLLSNDLVCLLSTSEMARRSPSRFGGPSDLWPSVSW